MANLQTNLTLTQIATKRLSGKAMTNINSTIAQEKIGSTVQTAAGSVFGEVIPASPNSASGMLNIIQSSSNSDPGTVQLVMFEITGSGVEYQNTVATDAGSVGLSGTGNADEGETSIFTYHAYALRLTGSYQADNTAVGSNFNTNASTATNIGTFPYSDNAHLSGSIGKLQIIPEYLGTKPSTTPNPYEVTLFAKDGSVISPGADIDWYLDQYSGMLFVQDPVDYEGGGSQNLIPAKLRAFIYVGKFQDAISSTGGNDNLGNHIATQDLDMAGNSISASLNITASGNISASGTGFFNSVRIPQDAGRLYFGSSPTGNNGYLYDDGNTVILGYDDDDILQVQTSTPKVSIGGNLSVYGPGGNITASGDISASSDILANQFKGNYKYLIQGNDLAQMVTLNGLANTIAIGDITTPNPVALMGSSIFFQSPVTASGDISASGEVYATKYYLYDTASIDLDVNNGLLSIGKHIDIQKTAIGNASRAVQIISPLTASSNISASGHISASEAIIDTININGDSIRSTVDSNVMLSINESGMGFEASTGDTFVFNAGGADVDFHISGENPNANLFYVNAGTNRIGIGMDNPSERLEVSGNIELSHIDFKFQGNRYASRGGSLVMLSASGQTAVDVGVIDGASGPTPLRFYAAHPTLGEMNAVTIDCSGSLTIGPNPNLVNNGVFNGYTSSLLPNFGNLNVAGTASIQGDVTASGALFVENVAESSNTGYKTVMYNPTDGRFYRTGSYGGGGGGTTVVANPGGSPGSTLTTITIGGSDFSIGGTGTPGGSNTQVQFNDGGAFGGDTGLTYNKTTDTLFISGAIEHAGDANTGIFFGSDTVTLKGNNATIAQFDTTEISFKEDLLSTGEGLFFSNQLYDWGNNNDVSSISGFRVSNDKAYSHLTPQPWTQRWALIGMPIINNGEKFRPYPQNYVVHGYSNNLQVTVTPGQGGGGGGGDNPNDDVKPDVGGGGNPGVINDNGITQTAGKRIGVPTVSIRGGDLEIIPSGAIEEGNTAGIRIASGDVSGSFDPGIFFYNRDNKTNVSGSFFYESASAEIRFDSASNSIKFLAGNTSTNLQEVLHISKSGNNPRIGIGTNQPIKAFDFKEVRDDDRGGELLIRGSRSTKGAENNDEVGRINFAIDSASYGAIDTSGSAAEIVAIVDDIDQTGVEGSLSLRVAGSTKTDGPIQRIKLIGNPNSPAVEITGSAEFDSGITANSLSAGSRSVLGELRVGTGGSSIGTGVLSVQDYGLFFGGVHVGGSSDPGADNLIVDGNTTLQGTTTTRGNVQLSGSYLNLPTLTTQASVGVNDKVLILDDGVVKQAAQTSMPYTRIADGVVPTNSTLLMFTGSTGTKEVAMATGISYNPSFGWLFSGAGSTYSLFTDNFFATSATVANVTASGDISASGKIITSELSAHGDLTIDADGADIVLKDGGTAFGRFKRDTSDFVIKSETNNKDIVFKGVDDSATITALTLDMSDAGKALFNSDVSASGIESSGDIHLATNNTQITQVLSGGATRDLIGFDGDNNAVIGNVTANKVKLVGNVTASGDISASGTITGNSIVGTLATAAQTNITSVGTLSSLTMGGDIDTDGNNINLNSGEISNAVSIDSSVFKMGNGSVSTPALVFTSDTNTGLYAIAPDTLGIATGGQNKISIGSTSTAFNNNPVSISVADGDGAVLSVTNTYSGTTSADSYAIKAVGNAVIGIPGGQNQAYAGHFTAGNTNTANPDTIALYAQGHEDGAPNSYAAIFSGSAGGVVGINTMEPTVELDVVGDISASGNLSIGGIPNVSASIAAAGGGGGSDNLGNHTATQDLDLSSNNIKGITHITASGNISASGIIVPQFDTKVHSFFTNDANGDLIPMGGTLSETTTPQYYLSYLSPYGGQLIRAYVMTTSSSTGDFTLSLRKYTAFSTFTTIATATGTINSSYTPTLATFSAHTFNPGDWLAIHFDPTGTPSGVTVTSLWRMDSI